MLGRYTTNNNTSGGTFTSSVTNSVVFGRRAAINLLFRRYAENNDRLDSMFGSEAANSVMSGRDAASNYLRRRCAVSNDRFDGMFESPSARPRTPSFSRAAPRTTAWSDSTS